MRGDVDQATESDRNDRSLAQLSVVVSAEENQTMKFKFATLALATVLALSSTIAFARNYHYHHRSYDRSNFYRSYNSMDMMPGYWIAPGGPNRSAISSGGSGAGSGAAGGP